MGEEDKNDMNGTLNKSGATLSLFDELNGSKDIHVYIIFSYKIIAEQDDMKLMDKGEKEVTIFDEMNTIELTGMLIELYSVQ